MHMQPVPDTTLTVAAIGCSGVIAEPVVAGFLRRGVAVRLLARNPADVSERFPGAEVVAGSMTEPDDVARRHSCMIFTAC